MPIPLEDNVSDIIGKAQRGLGISDSQLAERAGVPSEKVRSLRSGEFDDDAINRIAPVLKLSSAGLHKLASGKWDPVEEIAGLGQFNTTYHDITVNAYLVWDPGARDAVAFDTGADCAAMLTQIDQEKLSVRLILL